MKGAFGYVARAAETSHATAWGSRMTIVTKHASSWE